MIPDSTPMSLRAYARRRGVNHMVIVRAVKSGKLRDSVAEVDGRKMIADPDLADRELDANTDLSTATADVVDRAAARQGGSTTQRAERPPETMAEAAVAEKYWKSKIAELEYRKEASELVEAAKIQSEIQDIFTEVKTKLLGVPSRARQQDPSFTVAQLGVVEMLIREALEALAAEGENA